MLIFCDLPWAGRQTPRLRSGAATRCSNIGSNSSGVIVEPYLTTLSDKSNVFPTFQHGGIETIYMLEGEVDVHHGDTVYALKPGDTLSFDANAPHGAEVLKVLPAR